MIVLSQRELTEFYDFDLPKNEVLLFISHFASVSAGVPQERNPQPFKRGNPPTFVTAALLKFCSRDQLKRFCGRKSIIINEHS